MASVLSHFLWQVYSESAKTRGLMEFVDLLVDSPSISSRTGSLQGRPDLIIRQLPAANMRDADGLAHQLGRGMID